MTGDSVGDVTRQHEPLIEGRETLRSVDLPRLQRGLFLHVYGIHFPEIVDMQLPECESMEAHIA